MTARGYTHDQVIISIEKSRRDQFIRDIDELLGKKRTIPKAGVVPRKGTIKPKRKKTVKK